MNCYFTKISEEVIQEILSFTNSPFKQGKIAEVRARAPHPRLEQEAARVVNKLPKMQPGKQRGKPVGVVYSLPITFQIQD